MKPLTPKGIKSQDPAKFFTPTGKRLNSTKHSAMKSMSCFSNSPDFQTHMRSLSKKYGKSPQKTPKIDMKTVLQNSPSLYLKEDLGRSIDDMLSRAYETVIDKKHEKEDLDIKQEILLKEIKTVEKEITPLIFKKNELLQEIEHEEILQQQYESSLKSMQDKVYKKKDEIKQRDLKMNEKLLALNNKIKDLSQEHEKAYNEMISQRNLQKSKVEELRKLLEECKKEVKMAEEEESVLKKQYDGSRIEHLNRIEKLKNKERAYLSIIKH